MGISGAYEIETTMPSQPVANRSFKLNTCTSRWCQTETSVERIFARGLETDPLVELFGMCDAQWRSTT